MVIEITGVTNGNGPYDVFLCNTGNTSCFFVSGDTQIPPSVIINSEDYFPSEKTLLIKIIDTNGCVFNQIQNCSSGSTGTCVCEEYEILWGHPGLITISYDPCCPSGSTTLQTIEFPNPFVFSSSTVPNVIAGFGGILVSNGSICPCT